MSRLYDKNNRVVGEKRKQRISQSRTERQIVQAVEEQNLVPTSRPSAGRELYNENTKRKTEIEETDFLVKPTVPRGIIADTKNNTSRIEVLESDTSTQELKEQVEFESQARVERSVYNELIKLKELVEAENFLSVRREIK